MEIILDSAPRKIFALSVGMTLCIIYLAIAGRLFIASVFAGKVDLASLSHAVRFDPGNAEYRDHLGRYYSLVARNPAASVEHFRAAAQLDPRSARYWFDLASAYQVLGDVPNQTEALQHAINADPTTPDVAWEAANTYLVQGDDERALREFRVVLENDPPLADLAIQYCWRIKPDVDELLREVVPPKASAYIAFLNLLMAKQETAAAEKVWAALIASSDNFELAQVYNYFRFLVDRKDVDQAQLVWRQAAQRFGLSSYLPTTNNLIVNGDFRLDVLNAGFDWQYQKQPSVNLTLDPSDFHVGHRSLLIAFDGPGITDAGIRQYIPVKAGTMYQFSGYYKNGEIEGAGGPHLTLEDAYTHVILYDSDELKETGFWKSVTGDFTTGGDNRLLLLHVRRIPEGSPIRGKLWIDDFHLASKPQQP